MFVPCDPIPLVRTQAGQSASLLRISICDWEMLHYSRGLWGSLVCCHFCFTPCLWVRSCIFTIDISSLQVYLGIFYITMIFCDNIYVFWGFPDGSAGKESACNVGSIPGLGRSPGQGKGYPLQYSGLEDSMDCIVHGVAKSRTWLSRLSLWLFRLLVSWFLFLQRHHVQLDLNDEIGVGKRVGPGGHNNQTEEDVKILFFHLQEILGERALEARWEDWFLPVSCLLRLCPEWGSEGILGSFSGERGSLRAWGPMPGRV